MGDKYAVAGKGLYILLLAQVISIGGFLVAWMGEQTGILTVTLLGGVGMAAGSIAFIAGLFRVRRTHPLYQLAFSGMLLVLALSMVGVRLKDGASLAGVLGVAEALLSVGVICSICMATSALLRERKKEKWGRWGGAAWKVRILAEAMQQLGDQTDILWVKTAGNLLSLLFSMLFVVFCWGAAKVLLALPRPERPEEQ